MTYAWRATPAIPGAIEMPVFSGGTVLMLPGKHTDFDRIVDSPFQGKPAFSEDAGLRNVMGKIERIHDRNSLPPNWMWDKFLRMWDELTA